MRALLIDPEALRVTEIDPESWPAMRDIVGEWVDSFPVGPGLRCMVEDESLLKSGQFFWKFIDLDQGWGGKAIIYAHTPTGTPVPLPEVISLDLAMNKVAFLGNDDGFERAIQHGFVERPTNYFETLNQDGTTTKEKIWEWHPAPKEDRQ